MKEKMRLLILLGVVATFAGCEKQAERVQDFVFDIKQIATKDVHKYDFYSNGKIKNDYMVSYSYVAGIPIDSVTSKKEYKYNKTGKVVKINNFGDSTREIKIYNDIDSLVAEYTINNYGDTIDLILSNYENGELISNKRRFLMMSLNVDFNNLKKEDLRSYDTTLYISNFLYEGNLHTKTLSLDKKGNVTGETLIEYKDGKKIGIINYSVVGKTKFLISSTNYLDESDEFPDTFTFNPSGDTIGIDKTIYQDGKRIWLTANNMDGFKMQSMAYYDEMNRKIADVLLDLNRRTKTVYVYTYYDNGNLKEQSRYVEKFRQ